MTPITSKEFNQNKTALNVYEKARASRETNNLMLFTHHIPNETVLEYETGDLDIFTQHLQYSGRWGIIHRSYCKRTLAPELIPLLTKLKFNEIYYCHYISVESPICFLIVRATERHYYLLVQDPITNIICYGSIDLDEGSINTSIFLEELPRLVPESEVPLFMTAFTKDYGLQH